MTALVQSATDYESTAFLRTALDARLLRALEARLRNVQYVSAALGGGL